MISVESNETNATNEPGIKDEDLRVDDIPEPESKGNDQVGSAIDQ